MTAGPRREYAVALLVLVVGGVLGLVVSALPWATDRRSQCGDLMVIVDTVVTGRDLAPVGVAVSLAALAGVVAVVATRRLGRRLVGALLVVLGMISAVASARVGFELREAAMDWIAAHAECPGVPRTAWWMPAAQAVAGLMVAAAGVLVALRGPSWPAMGARYDQAPARSTSGDVWDALDRGDDPT